MSIGLSETQPSEVGELEDEARSLDLDATDLEVEHLEKDEQAKRSRGIDLLGLKQRKLERAQKKEAEKSELFKEINSLIEGHGNVRDFLQKQRLEKDYGKGRIGQLNARLACADLDMGPTFKQEAIARLKKMGIKTGITGGVGIVAGVALGGISWPVFFTAIAAGAAGRGTVELYRLLKGDERRQKKELAKTEQATADKITELIDGCNEMQVRMQAEDPELDIMSNPEYQKKYLEIVDLLHDSSKARVQRIGEGENEQYIGLGEGESFTEGAKQLNYGAMRTEVRTGEKKAESVANWVSMLSSLLGGLAAGAHEASRRAAEAGAAAKTTLENGGSVPNVNLDGDQVAHKVTLLRDAHNHLTDKLIYLKDHLHNAGEQLSNGMPNHDMYTNGSDVLIGNSHWHEVGMGYREALDMIMKAASSGEYNSAWIESAKAILVAGSAYFGQAMAEPTVNLFSESDQSKKQKLEQAMARYRNVLGGSAGGGDSDGGDSGSDGDEPQGPPPITIILNNSSGEGDEDESDIQDQEVAESPSVTQTEAAPTPVNVLGGRATKFWKAFDKMGSEADEYKSNQKAYMSMKISNDASTGKLSLEVPAGDLNEFHENRLAAYILWGRQHGYKIGEFKRVNDTVVASIENSGVSVGTIPLTDEEEPALQLNKPDTKAETVENLEEGTFILAKEGKQPIEIKKGDVWVSKLHGTEIPFEIMNIEKGEEDDSLMIESQDGQFNELPIDEWYDRFVAMEKKSIKNTDDDTIEGIIDTLVQNSDQEKFKEVDSYILAVPGQEPIEIKTKDKWSFERVSDTDVEFQIEKIASDQEQGILRLEYGGNYLPEELTIEEWHHRFSMMKKII